MIKNRVQVHPVFFLAFLIFYSKIEELISLGLIFFYIAG